MKQSRRDYIDRYAEYAMEQQRRYGIPASITLAQGIIESADGKSMLATTANNHFGVKGEYNGNYVRANDDKPNEKFKKYDNVGQSYEDHSKVLMGERYQKYVRGLAPDDYKGWIAGIQKGGYASNKAYCDTVISVIESCGLQKYDRMAMQEGKSVAKTQVNSQSHTVSVTTQATNAGYSMPVERDEFLLVTSPYGMREHPIDHVQKMHSGMDIKTNHDNLLATEDGGKVIEAGFDKGGSGNYVKLEYTRDDGSKTQVSYSHLSEIKVKVGDTVNAGQQLGVSGSTGKATGDHLHLAVKQISADGNTRQLDPAAYLAEVAEKGNLQQQALSNGQDLLAKYKTPDTTDGNSLAQVNTNMSADDWMKKLLSSEDSGLDLGQSGGDPIIEMVTGAFTGLMAIAVQIDNKTEEDKKQMVVDAATAKSINLTPYMAYHQNCSISVQDNGTAVLKVDGTTKTLSQLEMKNLSDILHSSQSDEAKMKNIAMFVDGIQLSATASQKYDMAANLSQEQTNAIQR